MLNNRIMKRIFIHPITFVSLAALLLIKAIVFGQLVLVLGAAPFLYLAWHFRDPALRQAFSVLGADALPHGSSI